MNDIIFTETEEKEINNSVARMLRLYEANERRKAKEAEANRRFEKAIAATA